MKILIVDDEEMVTEMIDMVLDNDHIPCEVKTSNNLDHAAQLIRTAEPKFDLVISDFEIEAGKGGDFITRAAKSRSVDTKVLVMSGHMAELEETIRTCCPADGFIEKPFKIEAFANKVRMLLKLPLPARFLQAT